MTFRKFCLGGKEWDKTAFSRSVSTFCTELSPILFYLHEFLIVAIRYNKYNTDELISHPNRRLLPLTVSCGWFVRTFLVQIVVSEMYSNEFQRNLKLSKIIVRVIRTAPRIGTVPGKCWNQHTCGNTNCCCQWGLLSGKQGKTWSENASRMSNVLLATVAVPASSTLRARIMKNCREKGMEYLIKLYHKK